MFTGLIEDIGKITAVKQIGEGVRFSIAAKICDDLKTDDSVAVNGCCLTVVAVDKRTFEVDAVEETLHKTTLGEFTVGTEVNLERAMRWSDRLGGHFVLGHVDGAGKIISIENRSTSWWITIEIPEDLERYIIHVGSLTVDGISLTAAELQGNRVSVSIIPHTWQVTTLSRKRVGDRVNVEADVIGKYVEKLLTNKSGPEPVSKITEEWLIKKGF